jgi:hypothetical protein
MRDPTWVSTTLSGRGGGEEGRGFSYLLESHMTYLAGSHILRSWPGIWLKAVIYGLILAGRQEILFKIYHIQEQCYTVLYKCN